MALDHFVSKFLTKPWEVADRKLWFYDFRTKAIDKAPSKELFSELGLHSRAAGDRLNTLIETPLSANRAALTSGPSGAMIGVDNWKLFRALVLLFPLQPIRLPKTMLPGALAQVLDLGDAEIDFIAHHWSTRFGLMRVRANPARPLLYPESGYFVLPLSISEPSRRGAVTIPITPEYSIAMVPSAIENQKLRALWTGDFVSGLSVGVQDSRVVVPPVLVDGAGTDAVGAGIEAERDAVVALFLSLGVLQAALNAFDPNPTEAG